MVRTILVAFAILLLVGAATACYTAQRADYSWRPSVLAPAYHGDAPRVLIDEGHANASTAAFTSRYRPFAELVRADGFDVQRNSHAFDEQRLAGVDVLVIANASGALRYQVFGINLPWPDEGERSDPAFSSAEIELLAGWVSGGGALLLIADHAPFGAASASLAQAFGVRMHSGFVEVPGEVSDPLLFSATNRRIGEHPILLGRSPAESIRTLLTFTGQSLTPGPGAELLLRLPSTAVEYVEHDGELRAIAAGPAQGVALEFGRGRVVILGEAAMLTAQVDRGIPFGFNLPDNDNAQFALNVMRWLARAI